jgi:hypothetical protein
VPDADMNTPFRAWKEALKAWNTRGKIEFRRLSFGDDDAFGFIDDDEIEVKVLGPIPVTKGSVTGLKFLGHPPKGPRIGQESLNVDEEGFGGFSASHTINGHSVVFRLKYGGFSYLFTGDLNDESSRILAREHNKGTLSLRSEVFKVPHHGSADFSGGFIERVSPLISVVSSGDESAKKEFIHPRSTIMGALGKHSRINERQGPWRVLRLQPHGVRHREDADERPADAGLHRQRQGGHEGGVRVPAGQQRGAGAGPDIARVM